MLEKALGLVLQPFTVLSNRMPDSLDVTSSPGHGTAFSVYLPRHAETMTEEEPEAVQRVDSRGTETVMIVEDEQILLNLGAERFGNTVRVYAVSDDFSI